MKKRIPDIICGLLILLFAYTAFSKLLAVGKFRSVLKEAPFIGNFATVMAVLIPGVELTIILLLLLPGARKTGLVAATSLLVVFTAYLAFMILTDPNLPCSCGGVIQQLSWKQHIAFNIFFIALGITATYFQSNGLREKRRMNILQNI
jgi:hypothetical protein